MLESCPLQPGFALLCTMMLSVPAAVACIMAKRHDICVTAVPYSQALLYELWCVPAGTTIWSPLASGVLSGKYSKGNVPADSRLAMEAYKVRHCCPPHPECIMSLTVLCMTLSESKLVMI